MPDLTNLLGLDRKALETFLVSHGEKRFRAHQLMQWVHQFGAADFERMTNMSKVLRRWLVENACVGLPAVVGDRISKDGTHKWLLRLSDGNVIETVFIPESDRGTLCISSQAGCILDCRFCATAQQGFGRNLTTAEIVAQLWLANQLLDGFANKTSVITNLVMMGMGEPLYNYKNILPALRLFMDDLAWGLSHRRVTVSTAGVVPHIDKLSQDCDVSLAVSLHAPNDEIRNQLVPLNRRFPVDRLLAACRRYSLNGARRSVTFEYVMLQGVNDQPAHARQLAGLLRDMSAKINLIPFNVFPGTCYQCSAPTVIAQFRDILRTQGFVATIRKTRGDDIAAACGQLAGRVSDRTARQLLVVDRIRPERPINQVSA